MRPAASVLLRIVMSVVGSRAIEGFAGTLDHTQQHGDGFAADAVGSLRQPTTSGEVEQRCPGEGVEADDLDIAAMLNPGPSAQA